MDKRPVPFFNLRSGQASALKNPGEVKPPFQFKLVNESRKRPVAQGAPSSSVGPLRPHFDFTQSSNLSEKSPTRGFDNGLQQSPFEISSRYVESRAIGDSSYQHHTPENGDRKSRATGTGTFSRYKDEPAGGFGPIYAEPEQSARSYRLSRSSTRDRVQPVVKMEEPDAVSILDTFESGRESDDLFGLASAKFRQSQKESAQLRECIADLESQLTSKNEENTTLSRTLIQTEISHKQAIDKHKEVLDSAVKNYAALKSEIDHFKRRSESSSAIISEAKATMDSLVALRNNTQFSLRDLESLFDDDGRLILSSKTRNVVHELRSELSKSMSAVSQIQSAPTISVAAQQVADLLREKLHAMGTDLAEARARVSELEGLNAGDRNSVESATLKLRQSGRCHTSSYEWNADGYEADQMAEVTRYLQEQRHESVEATTKVYEMEQQLAHAHTRWGVLTGSRDRVLIWLYVKFARSAVHDIIDERREEVQEGGAAKLRTLRHTIEFQEENMKGLEERARKADEELVQALNRGHELQGRLDSTKEHQSHLMEEASRLLSERDSTARELAEVQAREKSLSADVAKLLIERNASADKLKLLDDTKRDVELYRAMYNESQVSLKVLQERFDDQCVTLAATKESVGVLQERLTTAERQASEALIESKRDIRYLQEQKDILRTKLDKADKGVEEKTESFLALQMELSRREGAFQTLLEAESRRTNEALGQVQEMKSRNESLLMELSQNKDRMQEMDKRLATADGPSNEREREVTTLQVRIAELEAAEKQLLHRAATITRRYDGNDLNDNEKALVALLMQKTRAIHDREMVEKTNDIKRRDNIIKQHEARIAQLEGSLARRIYDETASAERDDEQGNSMTTTVGATKSLRSLRSSSSHQPGTYGTRLDGFSTTAVRGVAETITNQPIPVPGPPSRSTGNSTFSKLCREDSDDIGDFKEEKPHVLTGKRVMLADDAGNESSRPRRRAVCWSIAS
ncbi:hypothetical protein BU15DRAFT_81243 [Melanogaster broomeanus]|nr:hypothetical protein BU15DRAFT_81243 [Melanogaster broomeanus]